MDSILNFFKRAPLPHILALRNWLARPDFEDRALAERLTAYLLIGQPADVLDEIAQRRRELYAYLVGASLGRKASADPQLPPASEAKKDFTRFVVRHDEAM